MFNINDDVMKKLELISSEQNIELDTLVNDVLTAGLSDYDTRMSGGLSLHLPNPQRFHVNEGELREFISILKSVYKLNKSGYSVPTYSLASFIEQRMFCDSEELKADFEKYFYNCIAYKCDSTNE